MASDEFILAHWRRVSKEKAFRRRPILGASHYAGRYYYDCEFFDRETRQCRIHPSRPPICRAFPNHLRVEGRPPRLRNSLRCGFNGT